MKSVSNVSKVGEKCLHKISLLNFHFGESVIFQSCLAFVNYIRRNLKVNKWSSNVRRKLPQW